MQDEFRLGNCDCKLNQEDRKIKFVSICSPVIKQNADKPGIPAVSNVSPVNSNKKSLWYEKF